MYSLNYLHWHLVARSTLSCFTIYCSSFLKDFSLEPSLSSSQFFKDPSNCYQRESPKMQIWCHTLLHTLWWWFGFSVVSESCKPMDYRPPGSSVHGISQAGMLEWVAISFFRRSPQPRDQTWISCITGRLFTD